MFLLGWRLWQDVLLHIWRLYYCKTVFDFLRKWYRDSILPKLSKFWNTLMIVHKKIFQKMNCDASYRNHYLNIAISSLFFKTLFTIIWILSRWMRCRMWTLVIAPVRRPLTLKYRRHVRTMCWMVHEIAEQGNTI